MARISHLYGLRGGGDLGSKLDYNLGGMWGKLVAAFRDK